MSKVLRFFTVTLPNQKIREQGPNQGLIKLDLIIQRSGTRIYRIRLLRVFIITIVPVMPDQNSSKAGAKLSQIHWNCYAKQSFLQHWNGRQDGEGFMGHFQQEVKG